eukprot:sb/3465931/
MTKNDWPILCLFVCLFICLFVCLFICLISSNTPSLLSWVSNVTTRMSVFLVSVLSVIRCVTISPNVPSPKIRHAVIPVVVYFFIQVGQASLPLKFSNESPPIYFSPKVGACSWGLDDLTFAPYEDGSGVWYRFLLYFCLILPSFLPLFPVVVSCVIFVKIVLTSSERLKSHAQGVSKTTSGNSIALSAAPVSGVSNVNSCCTQQNSCGTTALQELPPTTQQLQPPTTQPKPRLSVNREEISEKKKKKRSNVAQQATTTMYIVTALYIIFNVPFWSFLLAIIFFKDGDHIEWLAVNAIYVHIFLSRTSVVMNAACNPIVYVTRIHELRRQFRWSRWCGIRRIRPPGGSIKLNNHTENNYNGVRVR